MVKSTRASSEAFAFYRKHKKMGKTQENSKCLRLSSLVIDILVLETPTWDLQD